MSSFVILDMEAIYGYVSGTTQEGAKQERDAVGQRRRQGKRMRRHRVGRQRVRSRGGGRKGKRRKGNKGGKARQQEGRGWSERGGK